MKKKTIHVNKTARYYVSGEFGPAIREVWFVCHGYGQLASDFLKNFALLNTHFRLIIAPEALHRFYLTRGSGSIGASWMTSEDREDEISDYVAYLDQLYTQLLLSLPNSTRNNLKITLLGFSQGTATVSRWALQGNSPIHRLILWGGNLPTELLTETNKQRLNQLDIHFVAGDKDPYLKSNSLLKQSQLLKNQQITTQISTFNGYHEIYPELLLKLAST